jgi:hypothetical protein
MLKKTLAERSVFHYSKRMKYEQGSVFPDSERERDLFEALVAEIEAYREAQIKGEKEDAEGMLEDGLIEKEESEQLIARAEALRSRPVGELVNKMLNNLWCHLPGGMYRDGIYAIEEARPIHEAIDIFIQENGFEELAERIVRRDETLDAKQKEDFLTKLYLNLRDRGFDRDDLRR